MPDQHGGEMPPVPTLSAEVGASLASVWAKYAGARPVGAETAIDGNVVNWTLSEDTGEIEALIAEGDDGTEQSGPKITSAGFKRALGVAVSRTTHRRVTAQISKQDPNTGAATETFILEAPHRKN